MSDPFSWDRIDTIHGTKNDASVKLQARLASIRDEKNVLSSRDSNVVTARKNRKSALALTQKEIKNFTPIVRKLEAVTNVGRVLNAETNQDNAREQLCRKPHSELNPVESKLNRLIENLSKSGRRNALRCLPASEEVTAARLSHLTKQAKTLLFQAHQKAKREKKIKSKNFHKRRKHDVEKLKESALLRLEEEDPVAAAQLREEYEVKRAEMRMQRDRRSIKKWATLATRFGGTQAARSVQEAYAEVKDHKQLLDRLAGRKSHGITDSASETSDDDGDSDDGDAEDVGEETLSSSVAPKGIMAMEFMKRGAKLREDKEKAEKLDEDIEEVPTPGERAISFLESKRAAKNASKIDDSTASPNTSSTTSSELVPENSSESSSLNAPLSTSMGTVMDESVHGGPTSKSSKKATLSLDLQQMEDLASVKTSVTETKKKRRQKNVSEELKAEIRRSSKEKDKTEDAEGMEARNKKRKVAVFDTDALAIEKRTAASFLDNNALVDLAFNLTNTAETEFTSNLLKEAEEKAAHEVEAEMPQILSGWGSWTGEGIVSKKEEDLAKLRELRMKNAMNKAQAEVRKKPRVKVMDEKMVSKYRPKKLPKSLNNANLYDRAVKLPIGPDWMPEAIHRSMTTPQIKVLSGRVIDALKRSRNIDLKKKHVPLAKL